MQCKRTFLAAAMASLVALLPTAPLTGTAQDATPAATYDCEDAGGAMAATPGAMAGMEMGTPMAEMDHMAMELDQMYIDMMIPHHASIIAMAQAALPRLEDQRLQVIAQAIVDAQSAEIGELRDYREELYGDPEPMPMDEAMMEAMMQMMPGISGTMDEMASQMDAAAQVAAICAAENTDLAFIEMTIAHHQMAIESSEPVVADAANEEIGDFAQRVIEDQQREIDELETIRADLAGEATPASA